jgi:hypothetical protein
MAKCHWDSVQNFIRIVWKNVIGIVWQNVTGTVWQNDGNTEQVYCCGRQMSRAKCGKFWKCVLSQV